MAIRFSSFLNNTFSSAIIAGFLISIQIDVFLSIAIALKLLFSQGIFSLVSTFLGITFMLIYLSFLIIFGYMTFWTIKNKKKLEENDLTGKMAFLKSFN